MSSSDHQGIENTYRALVDAAIRVKAEGSADDSEVLELLRVAGLRRSRPYLVELARSAVGENRVPDALIALLDTEVRALELLTGTPGSGTEPEELVLRLHPLAAQMWSRRSEEYLAWAARNEDEGSFNFAGSTGAEVWEFVGLACLARARRRSALRIQHEVTSQASRFAHAIGFDAAVAGEHKPPTEHERTVTISTVQTKSEVDSTASRIAELLVSAKTDAADIRKTLTYVLVELLRNVVQHSRDSLGGLVAAQVIDARYRVGEAPGLQIAVADNGIGIQRSLAFFHTDVEESPRAAVTKALRPHVSGAFQEGQRGGFENAGLGLFFVSEMAKATAGRFMLSSRGATLLIDGDAGGEHEHDVRWLSDAAYYPGTLVVVEIPQVLPSTIHGYEGLIDQIIEMAKQRTPTGRTNSWLNFTEPPPKTYTSHVLTAAPTMAQTLSFVEKVVLPRLEAGQAVALDFSCMDVLTQSRAHELLFRPLRTAFSASVPLYVVGTCPAIARTLDFVQRYALQDLDRGVEG